MLLGLSGTGNGAEVTVDPVGGSEAGDGGVVHGALLARFAEAVCGSDEAALVGARSEVVDALGPEGLVDAAAVCANFQMMVRVADATGTPIDEGSIDMSAELRRDLGLDRYISARRPSGAS